MGASFLLRDGQEAKPFAYEDRKLLGAMTLPFLFPAVHIVYGAGTLLGLVSPGKEG